MALPPKEMNTTCLRCGSDLTIEQAVCAKCGADRDVELAVAAELNPAIAALQKLLAILGGLNIALGALMYHHLQPLIGSRAATQVALSAVVTGLIMLGLCAIARRAPLPVSLISLFTFVLSWGVEVVADPGGTLVIGPSLGLRIFLTAVLFIAVRAALKARRIRSEANAKFPGAKVVSGQ